jgi:dihydroorotate dehydrogenase (NAD+) catalytic subunit
LAPHNKRGLSLRSPLVAGSGAVGFGDAWPPGVSASLFGALVTGSITWQPQRGPGQPRLVEVPGGFLLATGDQNPGYRRLLQQQARDWPRLGTPLLLALAPGDPGDWARLAGYIEDEPGIAGIELHLADEVSAAETRAALTAVRRETTLPLLAKLPAVRAAELAEPCLIGGADTLVVCTAPRAAWPAGDAAWVEAALGGPAAFPFTLLALRRVTALALGAPIVAAGGIQSLADAALCIDLGAVAVQIRSLLWTDPAATARLADGLASL